MCNLYQKKNYDVVTDQHQVWSMMKTRQDNDVIKGIDAVYAKNHIELLGPIGLDVAYDENNIR